MEERLHQQEAALRDKERYLAQKEQFLNTKENELLQKERDLTSFKDILIASQEETRAERDKLQTLAHELNERERLFNELMRQQSLSTTSTSNAFTEEFARALRLLNQKTNESR
jgi:hypothetical protein